MLAGGHCIPTCYALWMIMGQALERKFTATGDRRYYADPEVAILPIDALGFRRGAGALKTLLQDQGLADHPLFAQAQGTAASRRSPATRRASTSPTTSTAARRASASPRRRARPRSGTSSAPASAAPKIIAFEGEFAMTEGHAQELKTQALALKVGKRLRVMISDNNAGIDDSLIGGVIDPKFTGYDLVEQWTSYGWNVHRVGQRQRLRAGGGGAAGARARRIRRTAARLRSSARR